jgi:hypothetical membrane protein
MESAHLSPSPRVPSSTPRWRFLPWIGAASCLFAALGFAAALPGYSHGLHPLALLGASDVPSALAFNLLGFVLPGLLLVATGVRLRAAAGDTWPARIGMTLAMFSALAFAAQGAWPLDPEELDAGASRFHAAAWTGWWIAFVPAAALLAITPARARAWHVAAAILVPLLVLVLPAILGPAIAQRLAIAAWFAWWLRLAVLGAGSRRFGE